MNRLALVVSSAVLALSALACSAAVAPAPDADAGTILCCLPYDTCDALACGSTVRDLCTPEAQAEVLGDGGACPATGSVCEFRASDCPVSR